MTCIFKFVLFYRTRCRMPAKVLWALRSVCPFNNLTPLSVPKRQNQITLKGLKCNGRWKAKELVYVNFYVLQNPLPYVNLHVLKDSLLYEGRVWLWPYKVMFWGMQMTTLITNREGASEKSHTHAPPRTNAQRNPYKKELTWLYGEIEISVVLYSWTWSSNLSTINGLPGLSIYTSSVLQLHLNCKHSSLLK